MPKGDKESKSSSHKHAKDSGQKLSDGIKSICLNRLNKAKRIRFFHNGNRFFKGVVIPVSTNRYGSIDTLMADLTDIFTNKVNLPNGVRVIYTKTGRKVSKIDDLQENEEYVCSAGETFKKIPYGKSDVFQPLRLRAFSQRPTVTKF